MNPREHLQELIEGCERTIRDWESRFEKPPIDIEWFRRMHETAKACLEALDAGDDAKFQELLQQIEAAKDRPLGDDLVSFTRTGASITVSAGGGSSPAVRRSKLTDLVTDWVRAHCPDPRVQADFVHSVAEAEAAGYNISVAVGPGRRQGSS